MDVKACRRRAVVARARDSCRGAECSGEPEATRVTKWWILCNERYPGTATTKLAKVRGGDSHSNHDLAHALELTTNLKLTTNLQYLSLHSCDSV